MVESKEDFVAFFTPKNTDKPEAQGGFALYHWAGTKEDEDALAKEYKVTIRCVPQDDAIAGHDVAATGICPFTGRESERRVVFAKAY